MCTGGCSKAKRVRQMGDAGVKLSRESAAEQPSPLFVVVPSSHPAIPKETLASIAVVESVAATLDSALRDAVERACVVVTPGHLLAADYAFRMLGWMWVEPGAPKVVSCDVLGPKGLEIGTSGGPLDLEGYLARPLPPSAVMIEMDTMRWHGSVG